MQPTNISVRAGILYAGILLNAVIFSPFLLRAQKGKESTTADNTYGAGGTRSRFDVKVFNNDMQIDVYRDANKNRRQKDISLEYPAADNYMKSMKSSEMTYYDCNGKERWFGSSAKDDKGTLYERINASYQNGLRQSGSLDYLDGGKNFSFQYNAGEKKYVPGGIYIDPGTFHIEPTACPAIQLNMNIPKFNYSLNGLTHFTSEMANKEYSGGRENIDAYRDDDSPVEMEKKKIYDARGVMRHSLYREYYEDGCVYEEEEYFDCHGKQVYFGSSWYDGYDGYEEEIIEVYYKDGKPVSGYRDVDDDDSSFRRYFNPETGSFDFRINPELFKPEPAYKPAETDDCGEPRYFRPWDVFIGPSLIREDNGSDHFNTYGGELSVTRNLCGRGGITGDIGMNFGSNSGTDYTKFSLMAGGTYYPVKTATYTDPFSFSLHGLAGVTMITSKYGMYDNKTNAFSADIGSELSYKLSGNLGVGLHLDYLPVFNKGGNTSSNFRVGLGISF